MSALCTWCGTEFEPRSNGGRPQRFCSTDCRHGFFAACRDWAVAEVEAGRVSVSTVRTARNERARCVERDPASERGKAPEAGVRPDGPLTGGAEVAR